MKPCCRAHVPLLPPLITCIAPPQSLGRMGFNDQEIVALCGAHTLGRCHSDRSGFLGPWTNGEPLLGEGLCRQPYTSIVQAAECTRCCKQCWPAKSALAGAGATRQKGLRCPQCLRALPTGRCAERVHLIVRQPPPLFSPRSLRALLPLCRLTAGPRPPTSPPTAAAPTTFSTPFFAARASTAPPDCLPSLPSLPQPPPPSPTCTLWSSRRTSGTRRSGRGPCRCSEGQPSCWSACRTAAVARLLDMRTDTSRSAAFLLSPNCF